MEKKPDVQQVPMRLLIKSGEVFISKEDILGLFATVALNATLDEHQRELLKSLADSVRSIQPKPIQQPEKNS